MHEVRSFMPSDLLVLGTIEAPKGAPGPAWTATCGGTPIASGGLTLAHPGVAEVWVIPARDLPRACALYFYRELKRRIPVVMEVWGLRRVHALVLTDFPRGQRLVQALGFTREGTLRRYGAQGEDVDVYALVRDA